MQIKKVLSFIRDERTTNPTYKFFKGVIIAGFFVGIFTAVILPFRDNISTSTAGLILVVPVVLSSIIGGLYSGWISVLLGFLSYDFFFIPPYYTLYVGAAQNWVALVVYGSVMSILALLIVKLDKLRLYAQLQSDEMKRLWEVSQIAAESQDAKELAQKACALIKVSFNFLGVQIYLLSEKANSLELVGTAGQRPTWEPEALFVDKAVEVFNLNPVKHPSDVTTLILSLTDKPIGLLVLVGRLSEPTQSLDGIRTVANQLSLAFEKIKLKEESLKAEALKEVDRLRKILISAVSHDLRTPLATIKYAASSLIDYFDLFSREESYEFLSLIDQQADRLERMVASILDMSRIESGRLKPNLIPVNAKYLLKEALELLGDEISKSVELVIPQDSVSFYADPTLMREVLFNLIENAYKHTPEGTPILVEVVTLNQKAHIVVQDSGGMIAESKLAEIFELFNKGENLSSGFGLVLVKSFVDAQGQHVFIDKSFTKGTRFVIEVNIVNQKALETSVNH